MESALWRVCADFGQIWVPGVAANLGAPRFHLSERRRRRREFIHARSTSSEQLAPFRRPQENGEWLLMRLALIP